MANPQTRKRWSVLRRTQIGVTAFGVLVTAAFLSFDAMQIELPKYSAMSDFVFQTGMLLLTPTLLIGQALGLGYYGRLVGALWVVGTNTVVFFALGTVAGWLLKVCVTKTRHGSLHGAPANQQS